MNWFEIVEFGGFSEIEAWKIANWISCWFGEFVLNDGVGGIASKEFRILVDVNRWIGLRLLILVCFSEFEAWHFTHWISFLFLGSVWNQIPTALNTLGRRPTTFKVLPMQPVKIHLPQFDQIGGNYFWPGSRVWFPIIWMDLKHDNSQLNFMLGPGVRSATKCWEHCNNSNLDVSAVQ